MIIISSNDNRGMVLFFCYHQMANNADNRIMILMVFHKPTIIAG